MITSKQFESGVKAIVESLFLVAFAISYCLSDVVVYSIEYWFYCTVFLVLGYLISNNLKGLKDEND